MNQLNTDLSIKPKGINARIVNEFGNLLHQCDSINYKHQNNGLYVTVKINQNSYCLNLSRDYPFKMPTNISYNGLDYYKLLITHSDEAKDCLKRFYYRDCLCCSSMICNSNWMPTINICHIINEINNVVKIKKEIMIRMLCNRIRIKYTCYFAELEKYLFY